MSKSAYRHVTDHCFADDIGPGGLSPAEYDPVLAACAGALKQVRAWHGDGKHPFLTLPERRDDMADIEMAAARFREAFDSVIVLGTGGSSLGGRVLTALPQPAFGTAQSGGARVSFMENVDGRSFEELFHALDLRRTGFVVISKSGRTMETLAQFLVCLSAMREAVDLERLSRHFLVVTQPGNNPLRKLAEHRRIQVIDHDPELGGRFSALSVVGLLPAMIAGLDGVAARTGAAEVLRQTLDAKTPADSAPAVGAAINIAFHRHKGVQATVVMPYSDSLAPFGLWFRQLWAESLGKDGKGTTPIHAVGTVDQHSQLQLYLDGPADKLVTFITTDCAGQGQVIKPDRGLDAELDWLVGRTMGDLLNASQRATWKTLVKRGRPVRLFRLPALDGRAMGAMMMHFMLETVIAAHLLGVEPFDQPAVEAGKVLARRHLQRIVPRRT
jgi:glucose-6-phosphate isomerase